jgi:hypothetical protein
MKDKRARQQAGKRRKDENETKAVGEVLALVEF